MQNQDSSQDRSTVRNSGRPPAVSVVALVFILAGVFGLVYHSTELFVKDTLQVEVVWVLFLRLLAIGCGFFLLRGVNWSRWLALAWLAYHVVLSARHSVSEMLTHVILLLVISYFLYRRKSSAYFQP